MRVRAAFRAAGMAAIVSACATPPPAAAPASGLPQPSTRLGFLAVSQSGTVLREDRADERFLPASVLKLFVTAAAFHTFGALDRPLPEMATRAGLRARSDGLPPDLVLSGGGDPWLGAGPDCEVTCLEALADAILQSGVRDVTDVIGDATRFPHEPYAPGWSWDDLQWSYGAPVSALSVNGNSVLLSVAPGAAPGDPAIVTWAPGDALLGLDNQLMTSLAGAEDTLKIDRLPGDAIVSLTGAIPQDRAVRTFRLATTDPALDAAQRLASLVAARGILVRGGVRAESRRVGERRGPGVTMLAQLGARPLIETVREINEDSDNLQAELLLRHIAAATGGEGADDGLAAIKSMLASAGVGDRDVDLYDASGLSRLNRVTPRAMVTFLRWTMDQPWGADWQATLPVAGQTGTLQRRFAGTPLAGRLTAKTGTLTGVNALAGFLPGADGGVIVFAVLSNERPSAAPSVLPGIDSTLVALAGHD